MQNFLSRFLPKLKILVSRYSPWLLPIAAVPLAWISFWILSSPNQRWHEGLDKLSMLLAGTSDKTSWTWALWRFAWNLNPVASVLLIISAALALAGLGILFTKVINLTKASLNEHEKYLGRVFWRTSAPLSIVLICLVLGPSSASNQVVSDLKGSLSKAVKIQSVKTDQANSEHLQAFTDKLEIGAKQLRYLGYEISASASCSESKSARTYVSDTQFLAGSGYFNSCDLAEYLNKYLLPEIDRRDANATDSVDNLLTKAELKMAVLGRYERVLSEVISLNKSLKSINELLLLASTLFLAGYLLSLVIKRAKRRISVDNLKAALKGALLNRTSKTCPKCAEKIKAQAVVCKHCGSSF